MNKFWIGIIALVIIIGVFVALSMQPKSPEYGDESMMKDDSVMMEEDGAMKDDAMMEEKDDSMMMKDSGSYEAYSPEKLAKANDGDVVLFFRASWCPTCRALDSNIKSNLQNIPAGVTVLDVDYDKEVALKQKYGVTYQHTFVQVDVSGNMINKWQGSLTLSELLNNIK